MERKPAYKINTKVMEKRMKNLRLDDHALAKAVGTNPATISRYRRGINDPKNGRIRNRLAEKLKVDFNKLFIRRGCIRIPIPKQTKKPQKGSGQPDLFEGPKLLHPDCGEKIVAYLHQAKQEVNMALDDLDDPAEAGCLFKIMQDILKVSKAVKGLF